MKLLPKIVVCNDLVCGIIDLVVVFPLGAPFLNDIVEFYYLWGMVDIFNGKQLEISSLLKLLHKGVWCKRKDFTAQGLILSL